MGTDRHQSNHPSLLPFFSPSPTKNHTHTHTQNDPPGMSAEEAMEKYIAEVKRQIATYGTKA